ncbi:sigma-70 family RNA polymerase sigma factor [Radiobacillus deserti]|uniref:Sigma-70 family RNA polymerase sigma factor n=2 Tax=Radiobacillus deserti TaxID=2594883 RepID=A0A516KLD0_9BACI|nr:sigma-70 family RNA polymerase sigma factor [Radiobacillus deserti]
MRRYGQDILQLTYSYVKDRAISEDLTQEIFIKCYRKLHTYNKNAKLKTWLCRIAINHCKDYLKSWYNRNVQVSKFESPQSTESTPEEEVIQRSEEEELVDVVMNLPTKYRELIYLHYFEEMTFKQIAEVTELNINTIKTRMRKAKTLLQEMLGGS